MAVNVRQFKAAFPEFRDTEDSLIQSRLAMAGRRIHAPVWGDMADDGLMYLAAHLVSTSPSGENARLKPGEVTTYEAEWQRMKREVTIGFRVTGPPSGGAAAAAAPSTPGATVNLGNAGVFHNTLWVDGATTLANADQNGSFLFPFSTQQRAIDAVPKATDGASSRSVWNVFTITGQYNADLNWDASGRRIAMWAVGPVALGVFDQDTWQPSPTEPRRNIVISGDCDDIADGIHSYVAIGSLPVGNSSALASSSFAAFRVSGMIDIQATTTGAAGDIQGDIQAEVYGDAGVSLRAPNNPNMTLNARQARFHGSVDAGTDGQLVRADQVRFDALVTVESLTEWRRCNVNAGLFVHVNPPAGDDIVKGLVQSTFAGEFDGGDAAPQLFVDQYTANNMLANGATFGAGAFVTLLDAVQVQADGTPQPARQALNFAGAGVSVAQVGGAHLVTIPGGGAAGDNVGYSSAAVISEADAGSTMAIGVLHYANLSLDTTVRLPPTAGLTPGDTVFFMFIGTQARLVVETNDRAGAGAELIVGFGAGGSAYMPCWGEIGAQIEFQYAGAVLGVAVWEVVGHGMDYTAPSRVVAQATAAPLPAFTRSGLDEDAIITANANGPLVIDGVPAEVSDPLKGGVLVKDQLVDNQENGLWQVLDIGSAGTPWVMRWRVDWSFPDTIALGTAIHVANEQTAFGGSNNGKTFLTRPGASRNNQTATAFKERNRMEDKSGGGWAFTADAANGVTAKIDTLQNGTAMVVRVRTVGQDDATNEMAVYLDEVMIKRSNGGAITVEQVSAVVTAFEDFVPATRGVKYVVNNPAVDIQVLGTPGHDVEWRSQWAATYAPLGGG